MISILKALVPAAAIGTGALGFLVSYERISVALFIVCVALAAFWVADFVAKINGHDPWREIRKQHRRNRARRR